MVRKAGCNKPRFEILAPQNSNTAGGNPDAVVQTGENIVAIRAIGGQPGQAVDPTLFNRVEVTHKIVHRLHHVTSWNRLDSIYDKGLRPGGLARDGRKESFFSCQSQAARGDPVAQKKIKDYYTTCNNLFYAANTQGNPIKLPAYVGYPYDEGDVAICIDTKLAEENGAVFRQNGVLRHFNTANVEPELFPSR